MCLIASVTCLCTVYVSLPEVDCESNRRSDTGSCNELIPDSFLTFFNWILNFYLATVGFAKIPKCGPLCQHRK